jgi:tetratricopeptide (TPR) repeat protein
MLAWVNGELYRGQQLSQKALALARELGDRYNEAWSLLYLAVCFVRRPEKYDEAVGYVKEAQTIFQELDEKPGIASGLNTLGELARAAGDYERAKMMYEACQDISRETGEIIRHNMMHENLGFVAYEEGKYLSSFELFALCIKGWLEMGMKQGIMTGLGNLAGPLSRMGEPEKAASLLGVSEALLAEVGFDHHPSDLVEIAKYTAEVRSQLDETTFKAAYAEGQAMTLEQVIAYALEE